MKQPVEKTSDGLVRGLSVTAATMIVAGSMIGSGVFRKPSVMAEQLMSPELDCCRHLYFNWCIDKC